MVLLALALTGALSVAATCGDNVSTNPDAATTAAVTNGAGEASTSTTLPGTSAAARTIAAPELATDTPVRPSPTNTPRPAPPLPTLAPPAPTADGCNPNYSGACLDKPGDYDCAGGSGNGPNYTGRVTVIGADVYGLDRDGDGIGCE